jgi:hypothetical protein
MFAVFHPPGVFAIIWFIRKRSACGTDSLPGIRIGVGVIQGGFVVQKTNLSETPLVSRFVASCFGRARRSYLTRQSHYTKQETRISTRAFGMLRHPLREGVPDD